MDLPVRKALPHIPPVWVRTDEAIFFITINCRTRGANILCNLGIAAGLLGSVQFRHERGDWWAELFLLMPDHLHALVAFPPERQMTGVITAWKHFAAAQLGIEWQRGFFDHRLRHEESLREKIDYILNNPVRNGLVARAEDWPHVWMAGTDATASRPYQ